MQQGWGGVFRGLKDSWSYAATTLLCVALTCLTVACGPGESVTSSLSPAEPPTVTSAPSATSAPTVSTASTLGQAPSTTVSHATRVTGAAEATVSITTTTATEHSLTAPPLAPVQADVQAAFAEVASLLHPIEVYAPRELPSGSELANHMWPIVQQDAQANDETAKPNPWVSSGSLERSAEILVSTPDGWLLFLQNFRGDLGDSPGIHAGTVFGHDGYRYEMEEGSVVQWSHDGRWYAVYAQGAVMSSLPAVLATLAPVSH